MGENGRREGEATILDKLDRFLQGWFCGSFVSLPDIYACSQAWVYVGKWLVGWRQAGGGIENMINHGKSRMPAGCVSYALRKYDSGYST